jgi:NAD(P)H dehydrogenase (quinone)
LPRRHLYVALLASIALCEGASMIAVTGSTGELGGRVARRLSERGFAQRLIVRDAAKAPVLPNAEVRIASDYGATNEMRAALEGAKTLYLVSGRESQNRLDQHKSAIDAALAAGVNRIVYTSFLNAAADNTFVLGRHHYFTEQHIRDSGVAFAFQRQSLYLDFMPFFAGPDGVIRGPAGAGRFAAVSRNDAADVGVELLTKGTNGTFDVTGRELLTLTEVAAKLSTLTGRAFRFENETLEEAYRSRAKFGAPDWEVEGWVTSYLAIARGELDVVSTAVRDLTGHEPTSLAEFIATHPASYAHVNATGAASL